MFRPCPSSVLVLHLELFQTRLFAIWPMLDVKATIELLEQNPEDDRLYAMVTALAAATLAQTKTAPAIIDDRTYTADFMARECQRAIRRFPHREEVSLQMIRTAFFLHVYHENQEPWCVGAAHWLRHAVTVSQMMGLHKRQAYTELSFEDSNERACLIWLLFITERSVSSLQERRMSY